jgi:Phage integrase, N-terminal SAM-like domain
VGYVEDLRGKKQGQGRPRWRARYRDPTGRERSKSFARKVDAERFLVSIEDAKLRGAYVDPAAGKISFGEWAERWYLATAHLKPSTRRDYRMLLDHQVLPVFGDWSLGSIDTLAVKEWRAGLLADGLSPKRAGKALQVLLRSSARPLRVGGCLATPPRASSPRRRSARRCISWTQNKLSGARRADATLGCRGGRRVARRSTAEPGRARVHRSQGWTAQSGRFRQELLQASRRCRQRGNRQAPEGAASGHSAAGTDPARTSRQSPGRIRRWTT